MTSATRGLKNTSSADIISLAAIAITILGWASAFPAIRVGLETFGPAELGALRFTVAALPAALFLLISRPGLPRFNDAWRFVYGGAVFVAAYTLFLNYGELTVSAGAASFIINVAPIITAVLAMIMLGERFSLFAWIGTAISFAGIGLIALGEGEGLKLDTGALFILGAAICTATATIVQKPLFKAHGPLTVAAWNMVIGAVFLSPALLNGLTKAGVASTGSIGAVIYLGLVPSLVAYGAWAIALSRLPAGRASNYLYCIPPVATLMGVVWLGEIPGPLGVVGGLMALGGVIVVNLRK